MNEAGIFTTYNALDAFGEGHAQEVFTIRGENAHMAFDATDAIREHATELIRERRPELLSIMVRVYGEDHAYWFRPRVGWKKITLSRFWDRVDQYENWD